MRCGAISGRPAGGAKARRPQYFRFTEIDNGVELRHDFDGRGARPAAFACNSAPCAAIERLRGASGGVVLTDVWFSRDERKNKNRTYARLLQEVVGFSGNPNPPARSAEDGAKGRAAVPRRPPDMASIPAAAAAPRTPPAAAPGVVVRAPVVRAVIGAPAPSPTVRMPIAPVMTPPDLLDVGADHGLLQRRRGEGEGGRRA